MYKILVFSWHTLKYTDHYTDLIHPASSLHLSDTNRYIDYYDLRKDPYTDYFMQCNSIFSSLMEVGVVFSRSNLFGQN